LAAKENVTLPAVPDGKALEAFLDEMQKKDPVGFPDLSVSIIKLIGRGEYVAAFPGEKAPGHFGLALRDYTHSTAPNRRYPDLITGRLIKAALEHKKIPYEPEELMKLGEHCTQKEDDAERVERRLKKSAAALVLMSKIGKHFDAIVTGAGAKGTWVRILHPPVEGKLTQGFHHLDVGDRLQVKLVHVDVEKGFIDFTAIPSTKK
ncbi:MAG TPA: RNB domain-containing ribonuclease, partial [Rhabdochlamydiaceae bacterium]